ncbi:MAG: endolytic transglycosylase MltG [Lautropia sp.]|nr:endolytic transglycosylase MltG [Lautropia sp.]
MRKSAAFLFRMLLLLAVAVTVAAAYQWWHYGHAPIVGAGSKAEFEVRRGEGGRLLTGTLQKAGIPVQSWELALAWRLRGDSDQIKAGRYELEGPVTMQALLNQLIAGQAAKERMVVLIEGWTFRQVREALARAPELTQTAAELTDAQVMQRIDPAQSHPEGLFAPDTYAYPPQSTDVELLARAHRLQRQRLAAAWQNRAEGLQLRNELDLLILASIVEKESARPEDRAMVSAVFHNRLGLGMMLQSDPTTIYGIGEGFDGNLRRNHLRTDTPYNTYMRNGLTPTPISMPGNEALQAAARPAESKALYFVSRGDGSTEFSPDLNSHNRAVNRYQRKAP